MTANAKAKTFQLPKRYKPGFLRGLDRRSAASRQLRSDFNAIVSDLGGEDKLSRVALTMIERYVWLIHVLQRWERILEKNSKDNEHLHNRWIAGCNSAQGLAMKLGIKKAKASGGETLKEYLETRRA